MRTRRTVLEGLLGFACGTGMSAVSRAAEPPAHLEVGEASIDVSFDSGAFDTRPSRPCWTSVMQSARAATAYFGRFHVTHDRVRLLHSSGGARFRRGQFR